MKDIVYRFYCAKCSYTKTSGNRDDIYNIQRCPACDEPCEPYGAYSTNITALRMNQREDDLLGLGIGIAAAEVISDMFSSSDSSDTSFSGTASSDSDWSGGGGGSAGGGASGDW